MARQRRSFKTEFKLETRIDRLEREKTILKKVYNSSLNVGSGATYALIDKLREQAPVELICTVFDVPASSYYDYRKRSQTIDVERPDIPNDLSPEFEVDAPNTVRGGDVTYVWAESRWHYLAVVIDL